MTVLVVEQNANIALQVANFGYVLEVGLDRFVGPKSRMCESESVRKSYPGEEISWSFSTASARQGRHPKVRRRLAVAALLRAG